MRILMRNQRMRCTSWRMFERPMNRSVQQHSSEHSVSVLNFKCFDKRALTRILKVCENLQSMPCLGILCLPSTIWIVIDCGLGPFMYVSKSISHQCHPYSVSHPQSFTNPVHLHRAYTPRIALVCKNKFVVHDCFNLSPKQAT